MRPLQAAQRGDRSGDGTRPFRRERPKGHPGLQALLGTASGRPVQAPPGCTGTIPPGTAAALPSRGAPMVPAESMHGAQRDRRWRGQSEPTAAITLGTDAGALPCPCPHVLPCSSIPPRPPAASPQGSTLPGPAPGTVCLVHL